MAQDPPPRGGRAGPQLLDKLLGAWALGSGPHERSSSGTAQAVVQAFRDSTYFNRMAVRSSSSRDWPGGAVVRGRRRHTPDVSGQHE